MLSLPLFFLCTFHYQRVSFSCALLGLLFRFSGIVLRCSLKASLAKICRPYLVYIFDQQFPFHHLLLACSVTVRVCIVN
ncbi:Uncharacterized protein APZ42_003828 [Daphnia magna]|uniref:Uncharacterized protein n=1 Tax=Daphnia magna TaxID=35525 RepID=A0A164HEK9_9CRUS|nr:Uncharacterized protein APZ42_003828 [Daphnia magna]